MNHPRMTSDGRRWAFLIGIVIAFMLPKHEDCGYAGAGECRVFDPNVKRECTPYELQPWGFSLIEKLVGHDVGFAYSSGTDCD